jgi:hypothetical protein
VTIVFSVIAFAALIVVVLWLLSLPGEDNEEELAGLVADNWQRLRVHWRRDE